jgi:hypothetical protein
MLASTERPHFDWPEGLERPQQGSVLVYLDLGHWIELAKAAKGREGASHGVALAACRAAFESGRAIFPLSLVHYMEVSKISNRRQRADIAAMMMELSRCHTLIGRAQLLNIEREAAIDVVTELPRAYKPASTPYLGEGVMHTLGRKGALKLDGTSETMRQIPDAQVKAVEGIAQFMFERMALCGPQNDVEERELRERGWDPKAAAKIAAERAEDEEKLVALIDEHDPRRQRVRDFVCGSELMTERNALATNLASRPPLTANLLIGRKPLDAMIDHMPSLRVTIAVKTAYHRNPQTRWVKNTIFDIDAMSVAVPYCDIVATDADARSKLVGAKLDDTMDTAIIAKPDELVELLTY